MITASGRPAAHLATRQLELLRAEGLSLTAAGGRRVLRGGSWHFSQNGAHASTRVRDTPVDTSYRVTVLEEEKLREIVRQR